MERPDRPNLSIWIRLSAVFLSVVLVGLSCPGGPATSSAPVQKAKATSLSRPVRTGRLTPASLTESSGIVASGKYPGVYWSMNDSGHRPMLYAVDAKGKGLYSVRLTGAKNIDWEDIAGDDRGRLYVGDFGDNARKRKVLTIYIVDEPDPKGKLKAVAVRSKCRFRYPKGHGPFDCEAMFVRKGWAYLITKELPLARLYRVRLDASPAGGGKPAQAEYLGLLPKARWVTAADISPDGRRIAVLSYMGIWVYQLDRPLEKAIPAATRPATRPTRGIRTIPLKRSTRLRQAEAICWESGASPKALLITNEQREVYRVRLIGPAASQPAAAR